MVFDLVLTNRDPLGLPLVTQGILGGQLACLISNLSPTARHYNTALSFSLSVYASTTRSLSVSLPIKIFSFQPLLHPIFFLPLVMQTHTQLFIHT